MTSLVGLFHYYLWLRLIKSASLPAVWTSAGAVAFTLLGLSIPVAFVASRLLPRAASEPLSWFAFTWMGIMAIFLFILVPSEIVRWAAKGIEYIRDAELTEPERRIFLGRLFAGAVTTVGLGTSAVGFYNVQRRAGIKHVAVPLANWPAALEGLRIVQMSDIHVGPTIGQDFVRYLVEKCNQLEPDLVVITGDLVDGSVSQLGSMVAPLRELRARHGVYFVTGNHEYYSGADEWCTFLESLGIHVLRNRRTQIEHNGVTVDLAGVDDWHADRFGKGPDLQAALADRDESRRLILLAHQPAQIDDAARAGVDLQLSGHTHGGQIFPFNFLVRLQQPYVAGLHDHHGAKIYVSRGTGYWGPPMRVGAPAEITCLRLEADTPRAV